MNAKTRAGTNGVSINKANVQKIAGTDTGGTTTPTNTVHRAINNCG